MKTTSCVLPHTLLAVALLLFLSYCTAFAADMGPPGDGGTNSGPTYTPLNSWSFYDHINWMSDNGHAPISFTNLTSSILGDGASLVVNSTNQAWLNYHVIEPDGTTNLSLTSGTIMFWFAPSDWASTNQGGTGPGEYGRLLEIGSHTLDSSYGLWSIYVDDAGANIYFSTQTNDFSSNLTTYVSAPIAWTPDYFHNVTLTYSPSNTALYLDGVLATNGPPITVFPGPEALANGFYVGSDSNGIYQANGLFNNLVTYDVPLDAVTIQQMFSQAYDFYIMSPWNQAMWKLISAASSPEISSSSTTPNVITGQGNLQSLGAAAICVNGADAYQVWITNFTTSVTGAGMVSASFAIQGGQDGYFYDVFAGTSLTGNGYWSWQGQGQHGNMYALTNLPSGPVFIKLGTPLDSDGDGLTDAYELWISHTDPQNAYSNPDGLLDGWDILLGLNPQTNNLTQASARINYSYTPADWLSGVSGVKTGSVTLDNEGNVQTVSQ